MTQKNKSKGSSELDILDLQSNVVSQLSARDNKPYDLRMHREYFEQVENPGFMREFMEIAAKPLFQDFSTGRPNYTTRTETELVKRDFDIIKNFSDYVEEHATNLKHPADIDVKIHFLQDYISGEREERAARYALEVARRMDSIENVEAVEGIQVTTPYDFRDIMEILNDRGKKELPKAEDATLFVRYGPDELGFSDDEFAEALEIRNELNERYKSREYLNKGKPPVMEINSEGN